MPFTPCCKQTMFSRTAWPETMWTIPKVGGLEFGTAARTRRTSQIAPVVASTTSANTVEILVML